MSEIERPNQTNTEDGDGKAPVENTPEEIEKSVSNAAVEPEVSVKESEAAEKASTEGVEEAEKASTDAAENTDAAKTVTLEGGDVSENAVENPTEEHAEERPAEERVEPTANEPSDSVESVAEKSVTEGGEASAVRASVVSKKRTAGKIAAIVGVVLLFGLTVALLINALLNVFMPHYYPTFGDKRLFSIVTDSMEPEIPAGSMIASRVPKSRDEIVEGMVITFEVNTGGNISLLTHRVVGINTDASGVVTYVTRGDNTGGVDQVRPKYEDIVGIYTGDKCGFFGYVFGFLQSPEGAIALILIAAVAVMAYIVVRLVNIINAWKAVATDALKAGGRLLADTDNDDLGTIADVIGIAVKEPKDKHEARRKDKKLEWFIKTGTLPKRPYADDLDESAAMQGGVKPIKLDAPADEKRAAYVKEPFEGMRYKISYRARIIMLDGAKKARYSTVKNALMRYQKMRCVESNNGERFAFGRKTVARFTVRGKTLRLTLALDPAERKDGAPSKDGKQTVVKLTSDRRCAAAVKAIDEMMNALGGTVRGDYVERDYYVPYEGLVALMRRGLVTRDVRRSYRYYRIEEIPAADAPPEHTDEKSGDESTRKA